MSWTRIAIFGGTLALAACATTPPLPKVTTAWDAVGIQTYDNAAFARLFTDIGGYDIISRDDTRLVLQRDGVGAKIRLTQLPRTAPQARPPDAQAWEPGCYWSLMMRAKDLASIVEDARALGWEPRTDIAYLAFGPSKLNIVVLTHRETGAQVQFYERLTTPVPEAYPAFERFGVPFNIMQMASDRDDTYRLFTEDLGFVAFYYGGPTVSESPEVVPIGIPVDLSTRVPYRASIVSPVKGMELGRFEMIDVLGKEAGLTGRDFSDQCDADSVGLTHVYYDDADIAAPLTVRAPDGANITFTPRSP